MNELHLFAGAGGGILGGMLLGHRPVCAVEIEPFARDVLLRRQRDGVLPWFPIWDDITTFDGRPWRGYVDIVAGGFPCQDISIAGKGRGIEGERSGLWGHMARVVGEVRPRFVFVENSPVLTSRGLGVVLGDLAEAGYDARWCVLGANDAGAPHQRKRIWILAYSNSPLCGCVHQQAEIDPAEGPHDAQRELGATVRADAGEDVADGCLERLQGQGAEQPTAGASRGCEEVAHPEGEGLEGFDGDRTSEPDGGPGEVDVRSGYCGWWTIDPADLPDTWNEGDEQRFGQLREGQPDARAGAIDGRGEAEFQGGQRGPTQPDVGGVADGLADWLDEIDAAFGGCIPRVEKNVADRASRIKAIGNGQVPQVAALAFELLKGDWT